MAVQHKVISVINMHDSMFKLMRGTIYLILSLFLQDGATVLVFIVAELPAGALSPQ